MVSFVFDLFEMVHLYSYPARFRWFLYKGHVINFSIGIIFHYTGEDVLVADQWGTCGLCVKYYEGCKVNEYPFLTLKTVVKFPGNSHFDNGRAMGYLRLMKLLVPIFQLIHGRSFKYIFSIRKHLWISFLSVFKQVKTIRLPQW